MSEIDQRFTDRRNPVGCIWNLQFKSGDVVDYSGLNTVSSVNSPSFAQAYVQITYNSRYITQTGDKNPLIDLYRDGAFVPKTISYWQYLGGTGIGQEVSWAATANAQWVVGYRLQVGGTLRDMTAVGYRDNGTFFVANVSAVPAFTTGTWNHICWVWSATSTKRLVGYVNGSKLFISNDTGGVGYRTSTGPIANVFRYMTTGTRMSHYQIFDNIEFTESQVRDLYAQGRPT